MLVIKPETREVGLWSDVGCNDKHKFADSVVPEDLRISRLLLNPVEFEALFQSKLDPEPTPMSPSVLIVDVSAQGIVLVAWATDYQRAGVHDVGAYLDVVLAKLQVSSQTSGELLRLWNERAVDAVLERRVGLILETEGLDNPSLNRRRMQHLQDAGLDDASIARKRHELLTSCRLDDDSIKERRAVLKEKLRNKPG